MGRGTQYHTNQTHYVRKDYLFSDLTSGTAVTLGYAPVNSVVVGAHVVVITAFNSATSDVLNIGISTDDDAFATSLDLTTAGLIVADELATCTSLHSDSEVTFVAKWTGAGTAPTAGRIAVVVEYLPDNDYA